MQRKRERRKGDRRESPRVPVSFWVRSLVKGALFQKCEGSVSMGGVAWDGDFSLAPGSQVEFCFRFAGVMREVRVRGLVVAPGNGVAKGRTHAKFQQLALEDELILAKYLDRKTTPPC